MGVVGFCCRTLFVQGVLMGVLVQLFPLLLSSVMMGLCRSIARLPGVNDENGEEEEEGEGEEGGNSMVEESMAVEFCEAQDDMFMFMFSPFILLLTKGDCSV